MDHRNIRRGSEWEPEIHTAYVNVRGMFGRLNVRVGHLEVPFGLEPVVDSHSTLVPSMAMVNVGAMQDWGLSLNGQLNALDYEIAATTGAGMSANANPFERENGMYLISARTQPVSEDDTKIGVSALWGEMAPAHDDGGHAPSLRSERRVGVDIRALHFVFNGVIESRFEVSGGWRNGESVVSIESTATRPFADVWKATASARLWRHGDADPLVWSFVTVRRDIGSSFAVEGMLTREFSRPDGDVDTSLQLLLYRTL